jgi:hypothetical protein
MTDREPFEWEKTKRNHRKRFSLEAEENLRVFCMRKGDDELRKKAKSKKSKMTEILVANF